MAAGVPIVGADLEALRLAAPGAYVPYTPGDSGSLEDAVERAYTDEDLRSRVLDASFVRTWAQRAAEFEQFLAEVL
jgi:glycosyltransferase involved in cell wall biosynthesis